MNRYRVRIIVGIVAVCLSLPSLARHRRHTNDAAAGEFDYYLLSLSWSPAYCLGTPDAAECNGPRRYGFIVHGLWPQNERGWPEHCDVHAQVPDGVVQSVADIMPARGLVYHEWSAHGTCSGLDPTAFFAQLRRAYESVEIPGRLTHPATAFAEAPAAIADAFSRANPRLPTGSVVVTCSGQGNARLREVHICFNRDLSPRACSAEVLHAACAAPTILIAPLR